MRVKYKFKCGCVRGGFHRAESAAGWAGRFCPACYRTDKHPQAKENKACGLVEAAGPCQDCDEPITMTARAFKGEVKALLCISCKCARDHKARTLRAREAAKAGRKPLSSYKHIKAICPGCGESRMVPANREYTTRIPRVYCGNCKTAAVHAGDDMMHYGDRFGAGGGHSRRTK